MDATSTEETEIDPLVETLDSVFYDLEHSFLPLKQMTFLVAMEDESYDCEVIVTMISGEEGISYDIQYRDLEDGDPDSIVSKDRKATIDFFRDIAVHLSFHPGSIADYLGWKDLFQIAFWKLKDPTQSGDIYQALTDQLGFDNRFTHIPLSSDLTIFVTGRIPLTFESQEEWEHFFVERSTK